MVHFRAIVTWRNNLLKSCLLIKSSTQLLCSELFSLYMILVVWYLFTQIGSIYTDLGRLVVWHLKIWPAFDFQTRLVLSTENYFQWMIQFFNFEPNLYMFAIFSQNIRSENMLSYAVYVLQLFSIFFVHLYWFGYSKKNPFLGYIFKVVNRRYKNYLIYILFRPISEIDWYQKIFFISI